MTQNNSTLMDEMRTYLSEGSERDRERRKEEAEKTEFVGTVRDFLRTPELRAILKKTGRTLDLLTVGEPGSYSKGIAYQLTARHDGLYERIRGKAHCGCNMDAPLERWIDVIPYNGCFMYQDDPWKPDTRQYISSLEQQVRRLMK